MGRAAIVQAWQGCGAPTRYVTQAPVISGKRN
jgi:hypothetical protein